MTLDLPREHIPAPLWRRLAAMLYDSFLVLAIWIIVAFAVLSLFGIEQARTLEGDKVVLDPLYKNVLFAAMVASSFAFFAVFWMQSGQTLGMQAWKIKVQNPDGRPLSLRQCLIRYAVAPFSLLLFGLGYLDQYRDQRRRNVHDRLSGSEVVLIG